MKNIRLTILATLLGVSFSGVALRASDSIPLSVSVTVSPIPSDPNYYRIAAELKNLDKDIVIATPKIIVKKGESGVVTISEIPARELEFRNSISETGKDATYSVTIRENGKIIGLQKGSISIP